MTLKIYIFKTGQSAYKIGVSSNVEGRRNQVQTGCPTKVEMFKVYEVGRAYEVETVIHKYFSDFSTGREWFEIPESRMANILKEIDTIIFAANADEDLCRWIKEDNDQLRLFKASLKEQKYSERTVRSYIDWARRFLKLYKDKPSEQLTLADLDMFLKSFSNRASKSQRLARAAMMLFFEHVLHIRVRSPVRNVVEVDNRPLPSILSEDEIRVLLAKLTQPHRLVASLAYGSGLNLSECVALRLRDIDYENSRIWVRKTIGTRERETLLPKSLQNELKSWLQEKYRGLSLSEDCYLFPARSLKTSFERALPKSHINVNAVQIAVRNASKQAGLNKTATCMMLRHSFAVHLLELGVNLKAVQKLLGHVRIEATAVYLPLLRTSPRPPVSPLDVLFGDES